jgi:hypothetical protein
MLEPDVEAPPGVLPSLPSLSDLISPVNFWSAYIETFRLTKEAVHPGLLNFWSSVREINLGPRARFYREGRTVHYKSAPLPDWIPQVFPPRTLDLGPKSCTLSTVNNPT